MNVHDRPKQRDSRHAGLVLAAGASERMGQPKALLLTAAGIPLALHQAQLLGEAGYEPVLIVLGARYDEIADHLHSFTLVRNGEWQRGRFSSVQAGLRALNDVDGALILPVDTVGVSVKTMREIRLEAENTRAIAIRPTFHGSNGKIAWISAALFRELLTMSADTRLDHVLETRAVKLPVENAAILNNVNTPDDWARAKKLLH